MTEPSLTFTPKGKSHPAYGLTCFITGHKSTGPDDPILCTIAAVDSEQDGHRIIEMFDGRAALDAFPGYMDSPNVTVAVLPEFVNALSVLRVDVKYKGQGKINRAIIEEIRENFLNSFAKRQLMAEQKKWPSLLQLLP